MKCRYLLLLFIICSSSIVKAQQDVSFAANKLHEITQRYTSSSMNWPIVVKLAYHDVLNNTFTLSQADIQKLKNFTKTTLNFEEQQERIKLLVTQGATLFAKNESELAHKYVSDYLEAMQSGDLVKTMEIGSLIKLAIDNLEATLNKNRLVNVQAQLTKKEGLVDKRFGLLTEWSEAAVNDFFEESDGIKTHVKSYALLSFTDGSNVHLNPSTIAVIRKSRIDKLDESTDTEITLVDGGLLSKLSAIGREKSNYVLYAGASTTELKTQNFYAENSENSIVKLTNYDGAANVTANQATVIIRRNEGTIIDGDKKPLPAVKLLPPPVLLSSRKDSVIYKDHFVYSFNAVPKAAKYNILTSSSYSFDSNNNSIITSKLSTNLTDLPLGTTYIKVQSIDNLGLRGPFSDTFRVIRNIDTQAPPIFGEYFNGAILFTKSDQFILKGVTEPDAKVTVNDEQIAVSKTGSFSAKISIIEVDQTILVSAVDNSLNKETKEVRLVKLTPEILFNFALNGKKIGSVIESSNNLNTFTGKAYPEMEVIITNNDIIKTVRTDSQGKWGITMSVQEGKISITLKSIVFGESISTETYTAK